MHVRASVQFLNHIFWSESLWPISLSIWDGNQDKMGSQGKIWWLNGALNMTNHNTAMSILFVLLVRRNTHCWLVSALGAITVRKIDRDMVIPQKGFQRNCACYFLDESHWGAFPGPRHNHWEGEYPTNMVMGTYNNTHSIGTHSPVSFTRNSVCKITTWIMLHGLNTYCVIPGSSWESSDSFSNMALAGIGFWIKMAEKLAASPHDDNCR